MQVFLNGGSDKPYTTRDKKAFNLILEQIPNDASSIIIVPYGLMQTGQQECIEGFREKLPHFHITTPDQVFDIEELGDNITTIFLGGNQLKLLAHYRDYVEKYEFLRYCGNLILDANACSIMGMVFMDGNEVYNGLGLLPDTIIEINPFNNPESTHRRAKKISDFFLQNRLLSLGILIGHQTGLLIQDIDEYCKWVSYLRISLGRIEYISPLEFYDVCDQIGNGTIKLIYEQISHSQLRELNPEEYV